MGEKIDKDGNIYEKGWDGQYKPKQGLFGTQKDVNLFGQPNVEKDFFGNPKVERDWLGRPVQSRDGVDLYQGKDHGSGSSSSSSGGEEAWIGLVLLILGFLFILIFKLLKFLFLCLIHGFQALSEGDKARALKYFSIPIGLILVILAGTLIIAKISSPAYVKNQQSNVVAQNIYSTSNPAVYLPPVTPRATYASPQATPLIQANGQVAVNVDTANLRAGPGTVNAVVGHAHKGDILPNFGSNENGTWIQVDPSGTKWIAASLVDISDSIALPGSQVPVIIADSGSPSGKIVYTCEVIREPDIFDQICMINADGTGQRQLTDTEGSAYYPSLSPDGRQVIFISNMQGDHDIYELNLDTGEIAQLTTGLGDPTAPRISPDGRLVAFANVRDGATALYIMNRDGSDIHSIYSGGGLRPAWSPDGSQLSFFNETDGKIYVVSVSGSDPHPITTAGVNNAASSWSRDGRTVAFYKGDKGNRQIFLIDKDGAKVQPVTNSGDNLGPTFSPDGNWIGFLCYPPRWTSTMQGELCIIRTDGTGLTQLTHNVLLDWLPYWGP